MLSARVSPTHTHACVFKHEFSYVTMCKWALGTGEREFWRVRTCACA